MVRRKVWAPQFSHRFDQFLLNFRLIGFCPSNLPHFFLKIGPFFHYYPYALKVFAFALQFSCDSALGAKCWHGVVPWLLEIMNFVE